MSSMVETEVSALRRLRQENGVFKANLGYKVSWRTDWAT
jgi:hypothetical protein